MTDPTTLRTALEALIADGIEAFRLTREYVGDDVLPDEPGWSWFDWAQRARAALATPAPAADEARCEVCGEPTAMGQGLIVIDGKRQHQTCYMGIDQPAPTPAPPTPPATEPVAELVDLRSRFVRDLQDDNMGLFDGEMPDRLDAIVAAARAEVDVERDRDVKDAIKRNRARIEAAVRSDTLADVAARLPEALCAVLHGETGHPPSQVDRHAHLTAAILAHLTGGPR